MSLQSGYIGAIGQSKFASSATQEHSLGAKVTSGAQELRYVKAGAALAAGTLIQSYTENATEHSLTPTAAAAGATEVTVTTGGTVAANAFVGGYLVVTNTPGHGYTYEIESHPGRTGSGSLAYTLKDPLKVALTASSRVDLVVNPYLDCLTWVNGSGTYTGSPVGVAATAITSGQYGWVVCHGPTSCLADGTLDIGKVVVASNGTDGAVEVGANASTEAQPPVGYALTTGASGENPAIFVTIG